MLNGRAGGKRAKGRGGGGNRGVRGVDYGLGIGYSPVPTNTSSSTAPSRSAAVSSQRTGMTQFKSKFVVASSNSQNQGFINSSGPNANKRTPLRGFVSGGSIGGDVNAAWATNLSTPAAAAPMSGGHSTYQSSREDASHKNSER